MRLVTVQTMKHVTVGCLFAAALAAGGCADSRGLPTSPSASAPATLAEEATRSGTLEITKECSQFSQGFCTITSSNVKAIEVGTKVIYLDPGSVGTAAGSDVRLDVPGPGNNIGFGHCTLTALIQQCTFSGGTGKFTHFQATAHVSYLGGADFAWDGTYSFDPKD